MESQDLRRTPDAYDNATGAGVSKETVDDEDMDTTTGEGDRVEESGLPVDPEEMKDSSAAGLEQDSVPSPNLQKLKRNEIMKTSGRSLTK